MTYFSAKAPPYILKHLVEREAQAFRTYLGIGTDECLDPFEIAEWLGVHVCYPYELQPLNESRIQCEQIDEQGGWSGMTLYLPNAKIVTVLNSTHSRRRQRATLMEEVAHVYLGHQATLLTLNSATGFFARTYDKRVEQEAYWFGGAVLVPKCGLKILYQSGFSSEAVADHYQVSIELVGMRTNLCGLRTLAG